MFIRKSLVLAILALAIPATPALAADACSGNEVLNLYPDATGAPRYRVAVLWRTVSPVVVEGKAQPIDHGCGMAISLGDQGGAFWFFSHNNPEMLVKLVDGCAAGWGGQLLFIAATTNVHYSIGILDVAAGQQVIYGNDQGHVATPVAAMIFHCPNH